MEEHSVFNNLDYIVLGIILVSGLLALMRGFVREALSLASWGGAFVIAARFYPMVLPTVHKTIKSAPADTIASAALTFVIALIVFTLISFFIARLVQGNALTAIDRSLGFIFGILRGVLFVGIIYLAAQTLIWPSLENTVPGQAERIDMEAKSLQEAEKKEKDTPPQWIIDAKTFPALQYTAKLMKSFVPAKQLDALNKGLLNRNKATQKMIDDKELEILSTPTAVPTVGVNPTAQPGYSDQSRSDLNRKVNQ